MFFCVYLLRDFHCFLRFLKMCLFCIKLSLITSWVSLNFFCSIKYTGFYHSNHHPSLEGLCSNSFVLQRSVNSCVWSLLRVGLYFNCLTATRWLSRNYTGSEHSGVYNWIPHLFVKAAILDFQRAHHPEFGRLSRPRYFVHLNVREKKVWLTSALPLQHSYEVIYT